MSVLVDLDERFEEIKLVLEALRELERRQRANRRSFYAKSKLIAASKAAVYIMLYNAIESAMRGVVFALRTKIQQEQLSYSLVAEFWRLDALQARFLHKMESGTNHGGLLAELVPFTSANLSWDGDDRQRLPFSGNFGQTAAFRLSRRLRLQWKAPAGSLGGVDLENIRERRNALAHGLETFQQAGSQVTATSLLDVLGRVRKFMASYVAAIEAYGAAKDYLTLLPLLPENDEDLLETQDLSEAAQPQNDE